MNTSLEAAFPPCLSLNYELCVQQWQNVFFFVFFNMEMIATILLQNAPFYLFCAHFRNLGTCFHPFRILIIFLKTYHV